MTVQEVPIQVGQDTDALIKLMIRVRIDDAWVPYDFAEATDGLLFVAAESVDPEAEEILSYTEAEEVVVQGDPDEGIVHVQCSRDDLTPAQVGRYRFYAIEAGDKRKLLMYGPFVILDT